MIFVEGNVSRCNLAAELQDRAFQTQTVITPSSFRNKTMVHRGHRKVSETLHDEQILQILLAFAQKIS